MTESNEWKMYNDGFNVNFSSEYNNVLINKDIDNYFNDLISKPVQIQSSIKSSYTFEKFYLDYIEHNLLFIVLLIGIIIFLIIRQYIKDYDEFDGTEKNKKTNLDDTCDNMNNSAQIKKPIRGKKVKNHSEKINQIKKQREYEKQQLANYKRQLDMEKQQILTIIDELSNINDYEYTNSQPFPDYLEQNMGYTNGFAGVPNFRYYNQVDTEPKQAHNYTETMDYYDINKKQNDESNKIGGIYVEPPFS